MTHSIKKPASKLLAGFFLRILPPAIRFSSLKVSFFRINLNIMKLTYTHRHTSLKLRYMYG